MTDTHFLNCNIWPHNGGDGMSKDLCSCTANPDTPEFIDISAEVLTAARSLRHIKTIDSTASIDLSISGLWFVQAQIYQYVSGGLPEGKTCYENTPEHAVLSFFDMLVKSDVFLTQPSNHKWTAWHWDSSDNQFKRVKWIEDIHDNS